VNLDQKPSNQASVIAETKAYKDQTVQKLTFNSPKGASCQVTETRSMTNVGSDGKPSAVYRIDFISPKTQTAQTNKDPD